MISTHTLTWSVTHCKTGLFLFRHISTHTLTWSVTFVLGIKNAATDNFNSHAHVERDIAEGEFKGFFDISTHTLTWSVT